MENLYCNLYCKVSCLIDKQFFHPSSLKSCLNIQVITSLNEIIKIQGFGWIHCTLMSFTDNTGHSVFK